MAQGQPGRPPPGPAWRAPRHFVRDAVVFEDYTIAEGRVIPIGANLLYTDLVDLQIFTLNGKATWSQPRSQPRRNDHAAAIDPRR
jgi:hypothetical protein